MSKTKQDPFCVAKNLIKLAKLKGSTEYFKFESERQEMLKKHLGVSKLTFNQKINIRYLLYEEAIKCLKEILETDQKYQEAVLEKAKCLIAVRRFKEAVSYLNRFTNSYPDNFFGWYELGKSYVIVREFKKALNCFKRLLGRNEIEDYKLLDSIAFCLLKTNEFDRALATFQEAEKLGFDYLKIESMGRWYYNNFSDPYVLEVSLKPILSYYDYLFETAISDEEKKQALFKKAQILCEQKSQDATTRQILEKLLEDDSENEEAIIDQALILSDTFSELYRSQILDLQTGKIRISEIESRKKALFGEDNPLYLEIYRLFQRAVELNPSNNNLFYLATFLLNTCHYLEAIEIYQKILTTSECTPMVYYNLAIAIFNMLIDKSDYLFDHQLDDRQTIEKYKFAYRYYLSEAMRLFFEFNKFNVIQGSIETVVVGLVQRPIQLYHKVKEDEPLMFV